MRPATHTELSSNFLQEFESTIRQQIAAIIREHQDERQQVLLLRVMVQTLGEALSPQEIRHLLERVSAQLVPERFTFNIEAVLAPPQNETPLSMQATFEAEYHLQALSAQVKRLLRSIPTPSR
jgi:hypothetical protein